MEDEALIKKVKQVVFTLNEDGSFFDEMMENIYIDDPDLPKIREKMENLSNLIKTKGLENLLNLDFEDEIWQMI